MSKVPNPNLTYSITSVDDKHDIDNDTRKKIKRKRKMKGREEDILCFDFG